MLAGLVTACHPADSGSSFLALGVNDIGGAMAFAVDDGLVVGQLFEQGVDQNGDGDGSDLLLKLVDLAHGSEKIISDISLANGPAVQDGVVPFLVPESRAGRDLNGDGDMNDRVLHVRDLRGRIVSLGLATEGFTQAGALIAFGISEIQENEDLDGDGAFESQIACVYDAESGRLTSLRIAVIPGGTRMEGRKIVWIGDERGSGDLNGDGDDFDGVVLLYDADTGVLHDTGQAPLDLMTSGAVLALLEAEPGNRDLNGNGSTFDLFVDLCDLDTGSFRPTDAEFAQLLAVGGDLAVFNLSSPTEAGTWIYDRSTEALLPLTASPGFFVDARSLCDRRFAFLVDERQAGLDLDGDGQQLDQVLHVFDARSGVTASTGRAAYSQPQMDERRVAFIGLSNPPLDREHTSIQVQDLRTGVVRDTHLLATNFRLEDERILALVFEISVGFDLNGDGDLFDSVVQVVDLRAGITFDTGLAVNDSEFAAMELEGEVLVLNQGDRLKAVRMR